MARRTRQPRPRRRLVAEPHQSGNGHRGLDLEPPGTEMLSQTDDLFREIVSTMEVPASAAGMQTPPPQINLFVAMNTGRPFTLGKKAAFRLIGDPNCTAYVDLGDFKAGIPLTPVPPATKDALQAEVLAALQANYAETGHELTPELLEAVKAGLATREIYEGTYTVEEGEEAYGLVPKGYLVNAGGAQSTAVDAVHNVDIDSRPPAPVAAATAEALDGKASLSWQPSEEADLAAYEIWSSATPLSGFTKVCKPKPPRRPLADCPTSKPAISRYGPLTGPATWALSVRPWRLCPFPWPGSMGCPSRAPIWAVSSRNRCCWWRKRIPTRFLQTWR